MIDDVIQGYRVTDKVRFSNGCGFVIAENPRGMRDVYSDTHPCLLDGYAAYRNSKFDEAFLSEHENAINSHIAAKDFFDELNLGKLPTIKELQSEYAGMTVEKKKLYPEYNRTRKEMQDILMAEQNAKSLLNYREDERKNENGRG